VKKPRKQKKQMTTKLRPGPVDHDIIMPRAGVRWSEFTCRVVELEVGDSFFTPDPKGLARATLRMSVGAMLNHLARKHKRKFAQREWSQQNDSGRRAGFSVVGTRIWRIK